MAQKPNSNSTSPVMWLNTRYVFEVVMGGF